MIKLYQQSSRTTFKLSSKLAVPSLFEQCTEAAQTDFCRPGMSQRTAAMRLAVVFHAFANLEFTHSMPRHGVAGDQSLKNRIAGTCTSTFCDGLQAVWALRNLFGFRQHHVW